MMKLSEMEIGQEYAYDTHLGTYGLPMLMDRVRVRKAGVSGHTTTIDRGSTFTKPTSGLVWVECLRIDGAVVWEQLVRPQTIKMPWAEYERQRDEKLTRERLAHKEYERRDVLQNQINTMLKMAGSKIRVYIHGRSEWNIIVTEQGMLELLAPLIDNGMATEVDVVDVEISQRGVST